MCVLLSSQKSGRYLENIKHTHSKVHSKKAPDNQGEVASRPWSLGLSWACLGYASGPTNAESKNGRLSSQKGPWCSEPSDMDGRTQATANSLDDRPSKGGRLEDGRGLCVLLASLNNAGGDVDAASRQAAPVYGDAAGEWRRRRMWVSMWQGLSCSWSPVPPGIWTLCVELSRAVFWGRFGDGLCVALGFVQSTEARPHHTAEGLAAKEDQGQRWGLSYFENLATSFLPPQFHIAAYFVR